MSDTPATPPDFGEPWEFTSFRNCIRDRHNVLRSIEDDLRDRARVTVNACAGMADPAAEIAHLRDFAGRTHEFSTQVCVVVAQREAKQQEIEVMQDAIKEASSHLLGFLGFHSDALTTAQMRSISDCLAKLQPFLP
jgi:hypothetical protein